MIASTFVTLMMLLVNTISASIYNLYNAEYPYDYIKYATIFSIMQIVYSYDIRFKMLHIILFIFTLIVIISWTQLLETFIMSNFITLLCHVIIKKYIIPNMSRLKAGGTNIISKHFGEQVFVIALLNKIVLSDADVIMIPDCRMNEYKLLAYWTPIILKHKKYIIHQVRIERDYNLVMTYDKKNHIGENVGLSCGICLKNDGTLLGFLDTSNKYWDDNIMSRIKKIN